MRKVTITVLLMLIFIFSSNNAKAEERIIPYGVWTHIETDIFNPSFPISDKNTQIRIEVKNLNIIQMDELSPPPSDYKIYIQWYCFGRDLENFVLEPENASFTLEVKTGDYENNTLNIQASTGSVLNLLCYDIKITNLEKYKNDDENDESSEIMDFDKDENDKTSGKIGSQDYCYPNKCYVNIDTKSYYGVKKVMLYRKSSKNGKYKLVKTYYDGSDLMSMSITDKGLKSNKKYWYKIKTLGWFSKVWSDYSDAKVYWTCPKKIKGIKSHGNVITWKKSKGVSGYIIDIGYERFVGYNIFGQRLVDVYTKSYFVKSNKFKINKKADYVKSVRGFVKHNGRYYCTDGEIVKKKKELKANDVSRYRE